MQAAVESNHPIGKLTLESSTTTVGACSYTIDWSYDSSGRPTATTASESNAGAAGSCSHPETFLFTDWDSSGRPTTGTFSSAIGCTAPTTRSYDDANRTITYVYSQCSSGTSTLVAETVVTTYNANGLVESSTTALGNGATKYTTTDTYAATTQICD
jgi:hypothetical protein